MPETRAKKLQAVLAFVAGYWHPTHPGKASFEDCSHDICSLARETLLQARLDAAIAEVARDGDEVATVEYVRGEVMQGCYVPVEDCWDYHKPRVHLACPQLDAAIRRLAAEWHLHRLEHVEAEAKETSYDVALWYELDRTRKLLEELK